MLGLIIFGWHLASPGPVLSLSFYREQSQAKGTPLLRGFCKPRCTNLLVVKEILLLRLVANLRVILLGSPPPPIHTYLLL